MTHSGHSRHVFGWVRPGGHQPELPHPFRPSNAVWKGPFAHFVAPPAHDMARARAHAWWMVDAVIGAAVLASVHDSRWFPRKTALRKQIGTLRPYKVLAILRPCCARSCLASHSLHCVALQCMTGPGLIPTTLGAVLGGYGSWTLVGERE